MSSLATSLSHSHLSNRHSLGVARNISGAPPSLPRQNSFSHVPFNQDPNPIVIRKKPPPITYNQNISVRYIKPIPLPPHGDIVVRQMPDVQAPPQPPLHLRHQPPQPPQPPPQIIREQPPAPPPQLPAEVHTIPGRVIRPPQQVIREDFAPLPPKPASIIIERWLPYPEQVREIVYEPAPSPIHVRAIAAPAFHSVAAAPLGSSHVFNNSSFQNGLNLGFGSGSFGAGIEESGLGAVGFPSQHQFSNSFNNSGFNSFIARGNHPFNSF